MEMKCNIMLMLIKPTPQPRDRIARIAAIHGTKRTADLIPLCHPLVIDAVEVSVERVDGGATVTVAVDARGNSVHESGPAEWKKRIAQAVKIVG